LDSDNTAVQLFALRQAIAAAEKQELDELTIAYMSGFFNGKKKREWVGLTDEEIADIANSCRWSNICNIYPTDFAHAIEDKLREKNGC
jgi:hypothetical protein